MLKWVIGVIVVVILFLVIIQPEWLKVLFAIFGDFIQANEK